MSKLLSQMDRQFYCSISLEKDGTVKIDHFGLYFGLNSDNPTIKINGVEYSYIRVTQKISPYGRSIYPDIMGWRKGEISNGLTSTANAKLRSELEEEVNKVTEEEKQKALVLAIEREIKSKQGEIEGKEKEIKELEKEIYNLEITKTANLVYLPLDK